MKNKTAMGLRLAVIASLSLLFVTCSNRNEPVPISEEKSQLLIQSLSSNVGKISRIPTEGHVNTGLRISKQNANNHKIYYTHNSFSYNDNWLIYTTKENNKTNIFAYNVPESADGIEDGVTIQLTDIADFPVEQTNGESTESIVLSRKEDVLYYLRTNNMSGGQPNSYVDVIKLDFGQLISQACVLNNGICTQGNVSSPSSFETLLARFTWGNTQIGGGITMDYSEQNLFVGINAGKSVIQKININTGLPTEIYASWKYTFGHLTANQFSDYPGGLIWNWATNVQTNHYTSSGREEYLDDNRTKPNPKFYPNMVNYVSYNGSNYRGVGGTFSIHATWIDDRTIGYNIPDTWNPKTGLYSYSLQTGQNRWLTYSQYSEIEKKDTAIFKHHSSFGNSMYLLDKTYGSNDNTVEFLIYDALRDKYTRVPTKNDNAFGAHAHQSFSNDKKWIVYETREGGYQVNIMKAPQLLQTGFSDPSIIE